MTQSGDPSYSHPLDPLSADEIRLARSIVQRLPELSGDTCFPAIRLFEPPTQIVRDFSAAGIRAAGLGRRARLHGA